MTWPVFLLSAARAIVEMLGVCLLAQGALYLIAGQGRQRNLLYRLFAVITHRPLLLTRACLPRSASRSTVAIFCFSILFLIWIGLALIRRQLLLAAG